MVTKVKRSKELGITRSTLDSRAEYYGINPTRDDLSFEEIKKLKSRIPISTKERQKKNKELLERLKKDVKIKVDQIADKGRQIKEKNEQIKIKDKQISKLQGSQRNLQKLADHAQQLQLVAENKIKALNKPKKQNATKHWWEFWK